MKEAFLGQRLEIDNLTRIVSELKESIETVGIIRDQNC